MGEQPDTLLVQTTCPDLESARGMARALLDLRLAGCINLINNIESHYRWEGETKQGEEVLMLIKTPADRYPALQQWVAENHPYELPEIIAVDVTTGLPAYLKWINESARV